MHFLAIRAAILTGELVHHAVVIEIMGVVVQIL
jgi:hypothetical protein